jgi:hypothetical protein
MSTDFSNVRRNDPCPCGSGQKFKKCCFRKQLIHAETERETVSLDKFIDGEQDAYLWFKGVRQIVNRRDWKLLYETFAEDSAVKERFPTTESFIGVARDSSDNAPLGGDVELRRFRLLGDTMWVMVARGLEDRRARAAQFEVVGARKSETGFLITDFQRIEVEKDEGTAKDPAFEAFLSVQAAYAAARDLPWEHPTVARWDPETGHMRNPDGSILEIEHDDQADDQASDGL